MKNLFVSYEIAVKLKELGFKEACTAMYEVNDSIVGGHRLMYVQHVPENPHKNNKTAIYIAAPTHQQVQDWLREKHIYVTALPYRDEESNNKLRWYYSLVNDTDTDEDGNPFPIYCNEDDLGCNDDDNYDVYYEALNNGIKQALNLL